MFLKYAVVVLGLSTVFAQTQARANIPADGDYAAFDLTLTDPQGNVTPGLYEVLINDYDDVDHSYDETITTNLQGQDEQVQEFRIPETQLVNDAAIQNAFAHCSNYGGDIETVQTGAGPFQSCVVPFEANNLHGLSWLANVPFGYAKLTRTDPYGATQTFVLKSYKNGVTPFNKRRK